MDNKLKAALELLKDTCNEHFDHRENCPCANCPLYSRIDYAREGTHCFIRSHVPGSWKIDEWEKEYEQWEADGEDEDEADGDS